MKRSLINLIFWGALLMGSSCTLPDTLAKNEYYYKLTNPQKKSYEKTWKQSIEAELRKHDRWIEGFVEENYLNEKREHHVTLRMLSVEQSSSIKLQRFSGAYNQSTDTLLLPEYQDLESSIHILDSIDHELWHAIYDNEGVEGIFHSKDYKGPSHEEIAVFCREKVKKREFLEVKKKLQTAEESHRIKFILEQITHDLNMMQSSVNTWNTVEKYIEENKGLDHHLLREEKEKITDRRVKLVKKIRSISDHVEKVVSQIQSWNSVFEGKKELSLEQFIEAREQFTHSYNQFQHNQDIPNEVRLWGTEVHGIYDSARIRKLDLQITGIEDRLNKAQDQVEKKQYTELLEILKLSRQAVLLQSGISLTDEPLSLSGISPTLSQVISLSANLNSIYQILNNPNEVMARVVDSLYSIYFGPHTENKFPLEEKDLRFLGRFTFKGKPLFRKGIEKYRVAQKMLQNGFTSDQVKSQLEYATFLTYKGRKYFWPESRFTIKGEIPKITSFEKND